MSVCTLLCISQLSDSDKEIRLQPLQQFYLSAGFAVPPLVPVWQEGLLTTPYLAEQNKTKQNKIIPCAGPIHIFRSSVYLVFSFLVQNEDFAGELFI